MREGVALLEEQGYTKNIEIHRSLEMRYLGQNHELDVPIAFDRFDDSTLPGCGRPSMAPTAIASTSIFQARRLR